MRWPFVLLSVLIGGILSGCGGGSSLALKMAPAVGIYSLSRAQEKPVYSHPPSRIRASLIYAESSGRAFSEIK